MVSEPSIRPDDSVVEPNDDLDGDGCVDGDVASWAPGEIVVAAWNPLEAEGVITANTAGLYAIYDRSLAESGPSQTNESAYLQVTTDANPAGQPEEGNCAGWWVVVDDDNDGAPPQDPVFLGTFWLERGENPVTLHHYCKLYRAGQCQDFHNPSPKNGSCDSDNWNSVHLLGEGVCLARQED